ncbi:PEP-CTERM sorting domain-containing protein [Crocosphaera sp. XPORK-15E]|uniref:PEP-CTERM sorting domain-containing protein n=1 Tax=Crocosphaera sp. XPORK-15E TaxID=3110247 RepID=UPI002B1F87FD|nr:PEP-CTERM sorting domain-containing protein [Crocosphaera sp. XPORK-15E]MEA5534913.1 PEP-CTERM sorting domain-containing protein [Crocosphaera sp. XPORK-15E]
MNLKKSSLSAVAVAGVTSLVALLAPSAAMALTFSYSGDLTGQPTFNRPDAGDPPTGLAQFSTAVPFQTQAFTVDTTGSGYEIIGRWQPSSGAPADANPTADGYLFLYQDSFDPLNPLSNILSGDDDFLSGGIGCSPSFSCSRLPSNNGNSLTLTAGVNYIVVATQFSNPPATGFVSTYTIDINTPGNAQVIFPTAASVPEPTAIVGLFLVGGMGLLSKRQKQKKETTKVS